MSFNENPMNFRYGSEREIDLTELLTTLLNGWKMILTVVLMSALAGGGVAILLPPKWTSRAVITPADIIQWQVMDRMTASLNALGVETTVSREEAFVLFIKKFQSRSLLEAYLATSPYVISGRKGADTEPGHNYRQVVNIAQEMKAVDSAADKKADKSPYPSWTLTFTARTPGDAQAVLEGYIRRVSDSVSADIIKILRGQVSLKIQTEKDALERERARLTNIHDAALKRLIYSLEVASAAGITKPVYSNGQAVKDDPDYSVALGTDGLRRKLQIEQNLTDVTVMNPDFKNREYLLNQLLKIDVVDIAVSPFQYQQMPSLPVRKEGPGVGLIMLLAALLGGVLASGGLLLRNALNSSSRGTACPSGKRPVSGSAGYPGTPPSL